MNSSSPLQLVILSGISGSGKSTALNAFEDMGFYCVDNLPAPLISHFVDFLTNSPEQSSPVVTIGNRFALLVNYRGERSFNEVSAAVKRLETLGVIVSLLFFDCSDETILRRFQETRRPHPLLLGKEGANTVAEALKEERKLLAPFRDAAVRVIDTTAYTPHELRRFVEQQLQYESSIEIGIKSFGFKYGIPHDADLVVDVRFLPNPNFVPSLKKQTGKEQLVKEFVFRSNEAEQFLNQYASLLKFLIPRYQAEGKRYLTIAVGCTGGRHRSVAIGEALAKMLSKSGVSVSVRHRDIELQ